VITPAELWPTRPALWWSSWPQARRRLQPRLAVRELSLVDAAVGLIQTLRPPAGHTGPRPATHEGHWLRVVQVLAAVGTTEGEVLAAAILLTPVVEGSCLMGDVDRACGPLVTGILHRLAPRAGETVPPTEVRRLAARRLRWAGPRVHLVACVDALVRAADLIEQHRAARTAEAGTGTPARPRGPDGRVDADGGGPTDDLSEAAGRLAEEVTYLLPWASERVPFGRLLAEALDDLLSISPAAAGSFDWASAPAAFALRLYELRCKAGMPPAEVAERAGLPAETYERLEAGLADPRELDPSQVTALAAVLGAPASELLHTLGHGTANSVPADGEPA
jgi:Helix-turn-helix domain